MATLATPGNPLVAIVGQTAVGKTALSLALAEKFNGEIISADSRLVYKRLDIGTAKPSRDERARVPHHLIDICLPDQTITLGEYQDLAYQAIKDCHDRGQLPLLVGGTGQYVMAVLEGWGIPRVPPQPQLRQELFKIGETELARWLRTLDPLAAQRIDPRNKRRVVRALEVILVAGQPISSLQDKTRPPYDILILGLRRDRQDLYHRIDVRVDQMVAQGLLEEVTRLIEEGYNWTLPSLSGLGYRQLRPVLEGTQSLEEAVERIKFETHRFARQQNTWFRPSDGRIHWFEAADPDLVTTVSTLVAQWLRER